MKYEAGAILYNGKKNVLWGAGKKGTQTLLVLCELDIYIDFVCDSNKDAHGLRFFNKKVVSPDFILGEGYDCNIIIAVEKDEYVKEIRNKLMQCGKKNYVMWRDIYDGIQPISFKREYLYWMIRDSYVRKLVIYGADEEGKRLRHILNMLDVKVDFFLEDVENEYEWMGSMVKPIYDFFYEKREEYKIIVTNDKISKTGILDEMGLQKRIDYNICMEYIPNKAMSEIYILDSHLGYNFFGSDNNKNPGFIEMGEENDSTIVLLGGSATDGIAYPFKDWGKILYEKLNKNGYKVKILNGGCVGYKSSQELIKLIRDVIPLKPDVIIDYTGFNDANNCSKEYMFVHPYQEELLNYITGHTNVKWTGTEHCNYEEYTLGLADHRFTWEVFIDNIKIMNTICNQYGIRYCPFLQPSLPVKGKKMSIYERELVLNTLDRDYMKFLIDLIDNFYVNVKHSKEFICEDITSLLDNYEDIYMDICHVTEKGNEIIANYMFEYLTKKGIVKK